MLLNSVPASLVNEYSHICNSSNNNDIHYSTSTKSTIALVSAIIKPPALPSVNDVISNVIWKHHFVTFSCLSDIWCDERAYLE